MNILKIIKYFRRNKITKSEFCAKCNISPSMLDDVVYYGKNVDFKVAERMADMMGVGVYELYTFDYHSEHFIF